jgi:hypothetical protein
MRTQCGQLGVVQASPVEPGAQRRDAGQRAREVRVIGIDMQADGIEAGGEFGQCACQRRGDQVERDGGVRLRDAVHARQQSRCQRNHMQLLRAGRVGAPLRNERGAAAAVAIVGVKQRKSFSALPVHQRWWRKQAGWWSSTMPMPCM